MVRKDLITKTIDMFSRNLVGKFCKRIELLDDGKNTSILKKLVKELTYEECRTLKRVLSFYLFGEGKEECIIFGKEKKDEQKRKD